MEKNAIQLINEFEASHNDFINNLKEAFADAIMSGPHVVMTLAEYDFLKSENERLNKILQLYKAMYDK